MIKNNTVKNTEPKLEAVVKIGGGPSPDSVKAMGEAIVEILRSPCGDQPKTEAMVCLRESFAIKNVTISHCHISAAGMMDGISVEAQKV